MTKNYCDRCGKEIVRNKYGWLIHKKIYAKLSLIPDAPRQDWTEKDIYLCPECDDEFIAWFNKRGQKHVKLGK